MMSVETVVTVLTIITALLLVALFGFAVIQIGIIVAESISEYKYEKSKKRRNTRNEKL